MSRAFLLHVINLFYRARLYRARSRVGRVVVAWDSGA